MPDSTTPGSNQVFWYSYSQGPVHVSVISTEHDLSPATAQHRWLTADLASVNRTLTPWLLVAGHRPLYFSLCKKDGSCEYGANKEHVSGDLLRTFLDLVLLEYKVTAYLCGHVHMYERTCPLAIGKCRPAGEGTVHVVLGHAGAYLTGTGVAGETDTPWSSYKGGEDEFHVAGTVDNGYVKAPNPLIPRLFLCDQK
jgi:hypothetical protein